MLTDTSGSVAAGVDTFPPCGSLATGLRGKYVFVGRNLVNLHSA